MDEIELSNKLNTAPIELIIADDIIGFCDLQREEGMDLDYKSALPNDLEKTICAFANTQGGIILVGVDEEGKTRKPKLPIKGISGDASSIYQRIMNIASDNIYPPISPEIKVCDLPEQKELHLVLIRVLPSKLLHATDHRRRIYTRVADNSRGYDSLASVSELEWLWDRKARLEEIRGEVYRSAISRSASDAISWNSSEERDYWAFSPKLHVSIIPSFPTATNSLEADKLLQVVQSLPQVRSTWTDVDRVTPPLIGQWRSIPTGVCSSTRGYGKDLQYLEFGQLVYVHSSIAIFTRESEPPDTAVTSWAYAILSYLDITLNLAHKFLGAVQYSWPITISAVVESTLPMKINFSLPARHNSLRVNVISPTATDDKLVLLDQEIVPTTLKTDSSLLLSAAHNLFWAFGLGWEKAKVAGWVDALVTKRR